MEKPEMRIRRSSERGRGDHGWLDSRHTFSFADYHDPRHTGFRSLRVINEDRVAARGGFPTHPHRDMEIFSYVLSGALEHRDSLGNGRILRPGQIQLMSAGTGVLHSEFNPSPDEPARFLQVWILPRQRGLTPSYTEWSPSPEQAAAAKTLVISPDGRDRSAVIHQDAFVHRILLAAGGASAHTLEAGRGAWIQVAEGALTVNGAALQPGDGLAVEGPASLQFSATDHVEALLFDLA